MTKHDIDAPWDRVAQPGQHIHRESTRPAVKEDWLVPMAWRAEGAAVVFLLAFIGAALLRSVTGLAWIECLGIAVALGLLFWLWAWRWFTRLCWGGLNFISMVEDVTHLDINRDGTIGEPVVTIEVIDQNTGQMYKRLPEIATVQQIEAFCRGMLYEGKTLAVKQWYGRGKPFSRNDYDKFIAQLHARGFVVWRDESEKTLGRELTAAGRNALTQTLMQLETGGRGTGLHARTPLLEEDST